MKRRTLLKSALGALSLGLLGKSEPADKWVDEAIANVDVAPISGQTALLGTIVLGTMEWSISGNNWTVKRIDG